MYVGFPCNLRNRESFIKYGIIYIILSTGQKPTFTIKFIFVFALYSAITVCNER